MIDQAYGSVFVYERDFNQATGWLGARLLLLRDDPEPEYTADYGQDDGDKIFPDGKIRKWDFDEHRSRNPHKEATLRSWRRPRAIGGYNSRKAVHRRIERRLAIKPLVLTPFLGDSVFYLAG